MKQYLLSDQWIRFAAFNIGDGDKNSIVISTQQITTAIKHLPSGIFNDEA